MHMKKLIWSAQIIIDKCMYTLELLRVKQLEFDGFEWDDGTAANAKSIVHQLLRLRDYSTERLWLDQIFNIPVKNSGSAQLASLQK